MPLNVLGFYNGLSETAKGYRYFVQYGTLLDYFAPFQISIMSDGSLKGVLSRKLIDEAHKKGIKVLPVITNLSLSGQFSVSVLEKLMVDKGFADRVWQNIFDFLIRNQCDGVNLDLEHANPEDRSLFTQLIQNWAHKFKQKKFLVSIDMPAKTANEPQAEWKGAFDYNALGKSVDFVVLMTYEEHWPGSSPGSVASIPWVSRVVDYALSQISASKIYLGIPLYGYDWPDQGSGKAISYTRAMDTARRFGANIQWDANQHSAYYTYSVNRQRHSVYFENPRSLLEKVAVAKTKGLQGLALWEMNLSYPEFWHLLQLNLK